jgi:hypothetical protein
LWLGVLSLPGVRQVHTIAAGLIADGPDRTVILTGTLLGGYASDV